MSAGKIARPLAWVAAIAASTAWGDARAAASCAPSATPGVERCVVGLPPASLARMYQPQQASNWCWAATVAMVLRRYGLRVPQEQVARAGLGQPANVRVGGDAIARLLSRSWSDGSGQAVSSRAAPLPPWRRGFGVLAPEVLEELAAERPLVLGVQQHAMVLVQVVYERRSDGAALGPAGPRLVRATVLDPEGGAWLRGLRAGERAPDFLARVQVERTQSGAEVLAASAVAETEPVLSR